MSRHYPMLPERVALKVWDYDPKNYKVVAVDTKKALKHKETQDKILSAFLLEWHEYEILTMKVHRETKFLNEKMSSERVLNYAEVLDLDMDFTPADAILWRHHTQSMFITHHDKMENYPDDAYGMMFETGGLEIEYARRETFLQRM